MQGEYSPINMQEKNFLLLNIGYNKYIPFESIISIFDSQYLEINNSNRIIVTEPNKPINSYIYCKGKYLVSSFIDSDTLKKRYDNYKEKNIIVKEWCVFR